MPGLTPKKVWEDTGRWDSIDVLFRLEGAGNKEYALAATAEDIVTPLIKQFAQSYKDFPVLVYQISDKFRNELRAKSGILRGREFNMKDLYSFHLTQEGFDEFYEVAKGAYLKVYERCGLQAIVTKASGGDFTKKFSHEFQVETEAGEDTIYIDKETGEASNKEVVEEADWDNTDKYEIKKTIEVGNIFPLESRFSNAIDFKVPDENDHQTEIIMGSYGIGPSRVMGSIVEVMHDDRGIIWPKSVAPFAVHLISLSSKTDQKKIDGEAERIYKELTKSRVEVLWDDRADVSAGAKFADSDLIGIPLRLVVSDKTLDQDSVEWKERASTEMEMVGLGDIKAKVEDWAQA